MGLIAVIGEVFGTVSTAGGVWYATSKAEDVMIRLGWIPHPLGLDRHAPPPPPVKRTHLVIPELPYDPSAFWNYPDWQGGSNFRDKGFVPFWMFDPVKPKALSGYRCKVCGSADVSTGETDAYALCRECGNYQHKKPFADFWEWAHVKDWSAGACPRCKGPCRKIEINEIEFYTCRNQGCEMSRQAWGTSGKNYWLKTNPLRWELNRDTDDEIVKLPPKQGGI